MPVTPQLAELSRLLEEVWRTAARKLPGGVPVHRIAFSRRVVASWALIYYRRREVRLSPYVFLLPEERLRHGSDWRELVATVLHEVAHAHVWAETGDPGHPPAFASRLRALGVAPNGGCDLGPENATFRYRYACLRCGRRVLRRRPLAAPSSCASCSPGGFHRAYRLVLVDELPHPYVRLTHARERIAEAIREGHRSLAQRRKTRSVLDS